MTSGTVIDAARPQDAPDETATTVADAIRSRHSVRSFLPRPVHAALLRDLLETAAYAPSGSNMQPWNVFVLTGRPLDALGADIRSTYLAGEEGHARDYRYYPTEVPEPFLSRRRACGWSLYGTLGITRADKPGMKAQRATNYNFFGAPVGMVFTIHAGLEIGSWMDLGGFLQTLMIAARGAGLHSCAQASIAEYPKVVRRHLPVSPDHKIVCGMAMGYADRAARINGFRTERAGLDEFATFLE